MIAQYPGQCCFCNRPITVGVDVYDKDTRRNWHESCFESQPPSPEQFAIADRLGFLPHDEAMQASWKFKVTEGI